MNIQNILVAELKPAEYNPRKISKAELDKLKTSITEYGLVDPIIINKDYTVIGGHQRLKAIAALKWADVPCVIVDMPKDKEKALNIALNRISGDWDEDRLAAIIKELSTDTSFDLGLTGLDVKEIDDMIEALGNGAGKTDPDHIPELSDTDIRTNFGDFYQLGSHRVLCGDSTSDIDVTRLMGGGQG